VLQSFHGAIDQRIDGLANDVKRALGAPLVGTHSSIGSGIGATAPRAD
jgi:hypothetical protein